MKFCVKLTEPLLHGNIITVFQQRRFYQLCLQEQLTSSSLINSTLVGKA